MKSTQAPEIFKTAEECLRSRNLAVALEAYREAERLGYDADACGGARWVCYMLLGDFENAWRESDLIDKRGNPDPNRFWKGEAIANRHVLIRCLHGLGDTLQFIRYARLIRRQAASVTVEAQPSLKALLTYAGIADRVITWKEAEPHWDVQVEVIELPRIFRTTLEDVPAEIPYLCAPRVEIGAVPDRLNVGLVWASSAYNPSRSVPLITLSRICNTPGCRFFGFQAGEERVQLEHCKPGLEDLCEQDGQVLQTASRLLNLDLLITVDTMVAHLAGALGIKVWTLLPYEADWRWMSNRSDSPWYPTMQLFRQPEPGNWEAVVSQVQQKLNLEAQVRAA